MIVLFTDFGAEGPYVGLMEAAIRREAPGIEVLRLMSDAPAFDPRAAAHLLAALADDLPAGAVVVAVVDPGVGTDRPACVLEAGGRTFVGPGNGVFEIVARRAPDPPRWWEIVWRPERLSASFHGRDLFAPVAARLARGCRDGLAPREGGCLRHPEWSDDLAAVIYVDAFGNAMTGMRAAALPATARLRAGGRTLPRARTFADVPRGAAFCYENAFGLLEIAVNGGRADRELGLRPGAAVAPAPV